MVSHDLAVDFHMCDRLLVMRFGKSVELLDRDSLQQLLPKHNILMNYWKPAKVFRKTNHCSLRVIYSIQEFKLVLVLDPHEKPKILTSHEIESLPDRLCLTLTEKDGNSSA